MYFRLFYLTRLSLVPCLDEALEAALGVFDANVGYAVYS